VTQLFLTHIAWNKTFSKLLVTLYHTIRKLIFNWVNDKKCKIFEMCQIKNWQK